MESPRHFFILCCFGGIPYIDFSLLSDRQLPLEPHSFGSIHPLDFTDWIATDESGAFLNSSQSQSLPLGLDDLVPQNKPSSFSLADCDLFNLTFTSLADERVFLASKKRLLCRCPFRRFGKACQFSTQDEDPKIQNKNTNNLFSLTTTTTTTKMSDNNSNGKFSTEEMVLQQASSNSKNYTANSSFISMAIMLLFMLFTALVFMMLRYCYLCDCFGGFRMKKRSNSLPLDPDIVNRCLEAVNKHERETKNRSTLAESRSPLISSISETCPPPPLNPVNYGGDLPIASVIYSPVVHQHRSCSPPPSYHSTNISLERLS